MTLAEMFMDPAIGLFRKISEAIQNQELDEAFLEEAMNDAQESPSILFYFKASRTQLSLHDIRSLIAMRRHPC